jgi:hypothetical protein
MSAFRPWEMIRADMNYDGLVTISDIWLWLKWLFFLPGDSAIWLTMDRAYGLATFLEFSTTSYGGWLSGFLSVVGWLLALILISLPQIIAEFARENQLAKQEGSEQKLRRNLGYGESPPNRVDDR